MPTESFFSSASLAYLASAGAGKDGKTYSIKPTDGSGDFTFSRGSNLAATRVGPTGLIEKGRENLLTQSNNFSTWNIKNVTSGHAGYDGTNDAWLQSGTGRLQLTISESTGVYTASIYVKAGFSNYVQFRIGGSSTVLVRFELIGNGTTIVDTGTFHTSIEPVSGATGWYRISISFNSDATQFRIQPENDSSGTQTADSSVYVQDAQLEIGLAATDYIESGATTGKAGLLEDEPRFDYSGGATCPSLLLEPSRTNLIGYSEYFEGSDWTKTAAGTGSLPVITSNYGTSPEGLQNASRLQMNLNGGTASGDRSLLTYFLTAIAPATNSFYLKSLGGDTTMTFRCGSTIKSILVTSEWQRFNATDAAGTDRLQLRLYGDRDSQSADLLIYGAQLEQASYPTSYIPNHSGGGSVTRGADGMNNSSLGLTDCTFFVDFVPLSSVMGLLDFYDNSNARIFYIAINSIKYLQFNSVQGGTIGDVLGPLTIGNRYKLAFTLNASTGDITIFINGTKYNTYSTTISSLNKILQVSSFGYYNNTEFNQILAFPTALTDSECIKLTTL